MISLVIPTYRNPSSLDICLQSALEQQSEQNEIIVVVDGFVEESTAVLDKYIGKIHVLPLEHNAGMQTALNLGVYNASNEKVLIINDDNVLCKDWDIIASEVKEDSVLTINQIEPTGPGIFEFPVQNFGKTPQEFQYEKFIEFEQKIRFDGATKKGGIFPFAIYKKNYMIVGGFDTMYQSPFICDWDFFMKLDLMGLRLIRTLKGAFYHFGSLATKNRKDGGQIAFKESEQPAADMYLYKWGTPPALYENNSHRPKGEFIKGVQF